MVSTAKRSSPGIHKSYSFYSQKHIPAEYLKNLSMKIIPNGFLESIAVSEEIDLK